jgi:glycosyltransferase involved in cell wall biosynthesis
MEQHARDRLTILMPLRAYHPPFLAEAIESLVAQTAPEWQLLVVDDGAAGTEILEDALSDPRTRLVPNERRGMAAALNTGMREARTEFVTVLFADDMWSTDATRILTEQIEAYPDVDLFHSARVFIDESGNLISSVYPSRESFSLDDFAHSSPVKHLLCWRRERGLAVGGVDESLELGADDYDFPWCLAEDGAVFKAISQPLYLVRDHRECERLTTHLPLSAHKRDLRRIMEKHGVQRDQIERRVRDAELSYLKQCIYRSRLDRWLKTVSGYDARNGWRQSYEKGEDVVGEAAG